MTCGQMENAIFMFFRHYKNSELGLATNTINSNLIKIFTKTTTKGNAQCDPKLPIFDHA